MTETYQFSSIAAATGRDVMPLFKVGDRVERIDALIPTWMKEGMVREA